MEKTHADIEFDILRKEVPDAVVLEFEDEIKVLVKKFIESGQSGSSAPFVSSAIVNTVKSLCMFKPLTPITENEDSWKHPDQNTRLSSLFMDDKGAYYLNAIVWQGKEDWNTFTGSVYVDDANFQKISSHQYVKFPFRPKTFYIDVVRVPITPEEAEKRDIDYMEGGYGTYYTKLKDPKQLEEVFEYYKKPDWYESIH
jgi:hypothetical protein